MILESIGLLSLGIAVGIFGALVGVGGGLILVPIFTFFCLAPNGATFETVQQVIATSLFVVFLNSLSGAAAFVRQKRVMFRAGIPFALATLPGALLGSYFTGYFNGSSFSLFFGSMMAMLGVWTYLNSRSKKAVASAVNFDPATAPFNLWLGVALSLGVGFLSSMLGIGGGIVQVPMMIFLLGFPPQVAAATSTFILAVCAAAGVAGHIALDHIVWIPALAVGIGAIAGAQIGAKIASKSRPRIIVVVLSVAMMLVSLKFLWQGLQSYL